MTFHTDRHCDTCLRIGNSLRSIRASQKAIRARVRRLYSTQKGRAMTMQDRVDQLICYQDTLAELAACARNDRDRLAAHLAAHLAED